MTDLILRFWDWVTDREIRYILCVDLPLLLGISVGLAFAQLMLFGAPSY